MMPFLFFFAFRIALRAGSHIYNHLSFAYARKFVIAGLTAC